MTTLGNRWLLAPDEPPSFTVERETGSSPFLLICDHASARVPAPPAVAGPGKRRTCSATIGWDIGAAAVSSKLANRLDAFLILQNWSRAWSSTAIALWAARSPIVILSEDTRIPGNESGAAR